MPTTPSTSARPARPAVAVVLQQHVEDAAQLRHVRSVLVRAPHVGLSRLGRLDERLAAHLDGLVVAGLAARAQCLAALENPGVGETFALAVLAIETGDQGLIDHLLALWPEVPEVRRGLISAFGWLPARAVQDVVKTLLASPPGPAFELGIEACRLHRVDPGPLLAQALASAGPSLQAAAARAAGELGRLDLLPSLLAPGVDEPGELVMWKCFSACLLGERQRTLPQLWTLSQEEKPGAHLALELLMAASAPAQAQEWAQQLSQQARTDGAGLHAQRRLVWALALLGDLRFVPWLIDRMADPALARLAGEAFQWITGADLALLDLESLDPPAGLEQQDEALDDGSLGADDDLPWPDPTLVAAWWARAQPGLAASAAGAQLFLGRPLSAPGARHVLLEGTQRQRAYAALLASLLRPGLPVFPVAAPVPRQRQLLAAAGA